MHTSIPQAGDAQVAHQALNTKQAQWRFMVVNAISSGSNRHHLIDRLRGDLERIAQPRHLHWNRLGLLATRDFVKHSLALQGHVQEHHFDEGQGDGVNLILKLPGVEPKLRPILIGAHYDGPLNSVGADDNASGVAALLELARRWADKSPRRPVWLVAFDQEEWGMLGSKALAQRLQAEEQPLKLMVSLEMLAYTSPNQNYPHPAMQAIYGDRGDFIALVANIGAALMLPGLSRDLGRHARTKVLPVPNFGHDIPDVRLSDHSPFWDAGFDAVMITDTSFMRNPHYHQMSDTIETLDLDFLAGVIDGLDDAFSRL